MPGSSTVAAPAGRPLMTALTSSTPAAARMSATVRSGLNSTVISEASVRFMTWTGASRVALLDMIVPFVLAEITASCC